jgi:hypothetical protein
MKIDVNDWPWGAIAVVLVIVHYGVTEWRWHRLLKAIEGNHAVETPKGKRRLSSRNRRYGPKAFKEGNVEEASDRTTEGVVRSEEGREDQVGGTDGEGQGNEVHQEEE